MAPKILIQLIKYSWLPGPGLTNKSSKINTGSLKFCIFKSVPHLRPCARYHLLIGWQLSHNWSLHQVTGYSFWNLIENFLARLYSAAASPSLRLRSDSSLATMSPPLIEWMINWMIDWLTVWLLDWLPEALTD